MAFDIVPRDDDDISIIYQRKDDLSVEKDIQMR